jgi:AraC-like DNA-binding protein
VTHVTTLERPPVPHPPSMTWTHVGDAWRDRLACCFAGLTAVTRGPVVAGSLTAARLGEVGVFEVAGTTQQVRRTRSSAQREPLDVLKVCVLVEGRALVEQGRSSVEVGPGQLAFYDTGRPYQLGLAGPWRCAVMTVPRHALGVPESSLTQLMQRPHSAAAGAGRLLLSYLRECIEGFAGADAGGRVGEAGVALLAGTLTGHVERGVEADAELVRRKVADYVRVHVRDPELSPATVAAAHHMALRTLQRLFEGHEHNVAALIRQQRLDAVRRDLADPLLSRCSIAALGARAGVTDQAWLSRAFRNRFGCSPSEYRRTAHP